MNRHALVLSAVAAVAVLGLSACSTDEGATNADTSAATASTAGAETASEHSEADHSGTHEAAGETAGEAGLHSDADVMFAQMMMPHHEQAIEMSDIILSKEGVPADVVTLAEEIKTAQGPEIQQLTEWLEQWGEPVEPGASHGGHDTAEMEGMVSPEGLQQLSDAPGPEAAKLFLEQMIGHHEGAVTMAEDEVAHGTFQPAVDLSHAIIDTQQQEIDQMKDMLASM